eukprot:11223783-Lingulodinium_polyedra.AAC.1
MAASRAELEERLQKALAESHRFECAFVEANAKVLYWRRRLRQVVTEEMGAEHWEPHPESIHPPDEARGLH